MVENRVRVAEIEDVPGQHAGIITEINLPKGKVGIERSTQAMTAYGGQLVLTRTETPQKPLVFK